MTKKMKHNDPKVMSIKKKKKTELHIALELTILAKSVSVWEETHTYTVSSITLPSAKQRESVPPWQLCPEQGMACAIQGNRLHEESLGTEQLAGMVASA